MTQNITAGDLIVDLDDIRKIPMPSIQFHDEYRRGYAEALIDVAAIARRAEPSVAAKDGLSGVSLDEALYALDLVINNMNVPGLSGQMAYAKEVLARAALTSPAVSQMDRAAVAHVDEDDNGLFVEIIYDENGSPIKRGDKLYLASTAATKASASGAPCTDCGSQHPLHDLDCPVARRAQAPSRDAAPVGPALRELTVAVVKRLGWAINGTFVVTKSGDKMHTADAIAFVHAALAQQGASHAVNAGEDTERDAIRFRWLNEDHADAETREKARELAGRLGTSSYFSIARDIDAAIASSAAQEKKNAD